MTKSNLCRILVCLIWVEEILENYRMTAWLVRYMTCSREWGGSWNVMGCEVGPLRPLEGFEGIEEW